MQSSGSALDDQIAQTLSRTRCVARTLTHRYAQETYYSSLTYSCTLEQQEAADAIFVNAIEEWRKAVKVRPTRLPITPNAFRARVLTSDMSCVHSSSRSISAATPWAYVPPSLS